MSAPSPADVPYGVRKTPAQLRTSTAQMLEERDRLRQESQRVQQQFEALRNSVQETWAKVTQSREGSPARDLRHATLNLIEDTERARLREGEQAAGRERAEVAERASEARYRKLFESIDEAFCIVQVLLDESRQKCVDYRFLEVNPAFERHTGLANATGHTMRELAPGHSEYWFQTFGSIALTGEPARFEHRAVELGRDFDVYAFRTGEPQEHKVAILFTDITARIEAKTALERSLRETEQARAEAEAAGQAKDHFLAVLSHELRTPLTPVLLCVQTLMLSRDLPPQISQALEMIQRNVLLEAHFIDEMLDLTRISRGKFELSLESMDMHRAIQLAAEVAMPDIQGKAQRLTCALNATAHELSGDFNRLQQVFWNLLKNASKFTPKHGEIAIRTHHEPASSQQPAHIIVEVTDTGIGFDAEAAGKIFDAFTQADESITRKFGGLGLGLAISKASVDAHGGTIRAESPGAGKGATFTVRLPLGRAEG